MFTKIKIRTNVKQRCISVKGVNMWNALDEELKMSNTVQRLTAYCKRRCSTNIKMVHDMYGTVNMNVDLVCSVS